MTGLTKDGLRAIGMMYGLSPDEVHRALSWAATAKRAAEIRGKTGPKARRHAPPQVERRARWDFARIAEPNDGRAWCEQCDRRVEAREAAACGSPWCKAKGLVVEEAHP